MKTRNLLLTLGISSAAILGLENIGTTKTACETYQGYNYTLDGNVEYVFDGKRLEERVSFPGYSLVGDYKLADELKIGERYCFSYLSPIAPWASKRLKSFGLERPMVETE